MVQRRHVELDTLGQERETFCTAYFSGKYLTGNVGPKAEPVVISPSS